MKKELVNDIHRRKRERSRMKGGISHGKEGKGERRKRVDWELGFG